jgi:DNA polymerase-4
MDWIRLLSDSGRRRGPAKVISRECLLTHIYRESILETADDFSVGVAVRKILHIDMDAFYASVEQRDNPELKGKPLAVGYPAKRGVVAAASYEARKFGVRSAMPSVTAMRMCPALLFVAPRFDAYRAVSRQIHEIFSRYTDLIEPLSLDEAYLDITANLRGLPTAGTTATRIRADIRAETSLTASAGISYNKFLAKLASDQRKPDGQFTITPADGPAFIKALPVAKFHGIGPVTAEKMTRLGIVTGADLRARSRDFLIEEFGKAGIWYYAIARGEDDRPVEPDRPRKSYSSENTLLEDATDASVIEAEVRERAQEVWSWCQKNGTYGRTVTVKIKYGDFQQATRSKTLPTLVNTESAFIEVSLELIRSVFPVEKGVRLLGVALSGFPDTSSTQLSFNELLMVQDEASTGDVSKALER